MEDFTYVIDYLHNIGTIVKYNENICLNPSVIVSTISKFIFNPQLAVGLIVITKMF